MNLHIFGYLLKNPPSWALKKTTWGFLSTLFRRHTRYSKFGVKNCNNRIKKIRNHIKKYRMKLISSTPHLWHAKTPETVKSTTDKQLSDSLCRSSLWRNELRGIVTVLNLGCKVVSNEAHVTNLVLNHCTTTHDRSVNHVLDQKWTRRYSGLGTPFIFRTEKKLKFQDIFQDIRVTKTRFLSFRALITSEHLELRLK